MKINRHLFRLNRPTRVFLAAGIAVTGTLAIGLQPAQAQAEIKIGSENLERYLVQQGFDSGTVDGVISFSDSLRIKRLDLRNMDINSFDGIGEFKNLEYLDISGNDDLDGSIFIYEENQSLKTLKASGTKIKEFIAYGTRLENIDFSNNRNITRLEILGARMKSLNVTGATKLKYLRFNGGSMTSVDLSTQWDLDELTITSNELNSIDLTPLSKLTLLDLTGNNLTNIDVSKNSSLRDLRISGNKLTALDTSKLLGLQFLDAAANILTSVDLSANTRLLTTNLSDNKLVSLKLPTSEYLAKLELGGNRLKTLDLSGLPELFSIHVEANRLKTLDLRNQVRLKGLNVGFNPIANVLMPTNLSQFVYLDVSATRIKKLDLRGANLEESSTSLDNWWDDALYNGGGVGGIGLWSHDTKITLVVDNPPLVRADAGHSIDDNVKLVRK